MHRLSLVALWGGVALFLTLAVTDALLDFTGHLQGLFIGGTAACFIGAILRTGLHKLNETLIANRRKSEQVRDDVDQLRTQVDGLHAKVGEVRDLTKAGALIRAAGQAKTPEPDDHDAVIYQFRLRSGDGAEVIAGSRTRDVNADEILAVLEENDTGTMPGRFSAS